MIFCRKSLRSRWGFAYGHRNSIDLLIKSSLLSEDGEFCGGTSHERHAHWSWLGYEHRDLWHGQSWPWVRVAPDSHCFSCLLLLEYAFIHSWFSSLSLFFFSTFGICQFYIFIEIGRLEIRFLLFSIGKSDCCSAKFGVEFCFLLILLRTYWFMFVNLLLHFLNLFVWLLYVL